MTAVLGTRFCRTVCPYAMLQNVVSDRETISVEYDASRGECLRCGGCVERCPVGIDVRKGQQRECIACAGCIDACIRTTEAAGVDPFVSYRGTIWRPKAYLLAGAAAVAGLVFSAATLQAPAVSFSVQWERPAAGPAANVYRYSVRNGRAEPLSLDLSVEGGRLLGDPRITVPPGSRATGRATVAAESPPPREVRFTATDGLLRLGETAAFP